MTIVGQRGNGKQTFVPSGSVFAYAVLVWMICVLLSATAASQSAPGTINPLSYPGADLCLQIRAAISSNAPTNPQGLIVDARGAVGIQQCSVNPLGGAAVPGQLLLGTTVLKTTAPIVTPSANQWQILGVGRGRFGGTIQVGTSIQAVAGFPVNGKVVRLGDGTALTFGNRIENLAIDCNDIGGTVGLYSSDIQEESGGSNLVITRCPAHGLWINGSGTDGVAPYADNYDFHDVEALALTASNPAHIACEFDGNTATQNNGPHIVDGLTCSGTNIAVAFLFDGISAAHISNLNAEGASTGYLIGNLAPVNAVTIDTMRGAGISGDLVHIRLVSSPTGNVTQGIALNNIINADATAPVTLQDDILGNTLTDFVIGSYGMGEPISRPGGGYTHLSSSPGAAAQLSQLALDNGADHTNLVKIGSGDSTVQGSLLEFEDRGNPLWNMGKEGTNSFQIFDIAGGIERLYAQASSSTFINSAGDTSVLMNLGTGSGTGGTVFGSGGSSPAAVATIDGTGLGKFANLGVTGPAGGAVQSDGITFYDRGAPKWELGKDTTNSFQLYDYAGSVERFYIQPDASLSVNSAGSAPILLNVNNGSGTGGTVFGSGGSSSNAVASVSASGEGSFSNVAIASIGASPRYLCTTTGGLVTNVGCSASAISSATRPGGASAGLQETPWSSSAASVSSAFGRTGMIAAVSGDYAVDQISGAAPIDNPSFTGTLSTPSIGGTGVVAFAPGAPEVSGEGAITACVASHVCDSYSGAFFLTTGGGPITSSVGKMATIHMPFARTNLPNCVVTSQDDETRASAESFVDYPDTSTVTISARTVLHPSRRYRITYICGGN